MLLLVALLPGCMNTLIPGGDSGEDPVESTGLPGIPQNVTATEGDKLVTVSWKAPADLASGDTPAGSSAVYKHVAWIVNDTLRIYADTSRNCTAYAPETACTIKGLTNGTPYRFVVAAFNKAAEGENCRNHEYPGAFNSAFTIGRGCASAFVRGTPNGIVLKVPGAPDTVKAAAGYEHVVVSWTAPAFDGGTAITGYIVTALSDTSKQCTTTGALTCTVTGLTNGESYMFVVQATNSVGAGTEWAASPPVTPALPPGAPTGVVAVAGRLQVKVSWTAPNSDGGAPITGYTAYAASDTTKRCTTTGALTCTVYSVTNGAPYTFVVRARNVAGGGALSAPSSAVTPTAPAAWTGRTSPTTNTLTAVALAGASYVVVGLSATILTSSNGTNWTSRNSGGGPALYGVAGSGSQWVAVGAGGTILVSPQGTVWTSRSTGNATLKGVVRAGTQWVVVGVAGTILTSPDGVSWTPRVSGTQDTLNSVAWSGSLLTAVGASGRILTSPDGVTWTSRVSGTTNGFNGVVWADSVFAAVGGNSAPQVRTSPDGITWTARVTAAISSTALNGVAWMGNQLLVVGSGGAVFGTEDPLNQTEYLTDLGDNMYGTAGTPTQWVVVGAGGAIATSP